MLRRSILRSTIQYSSIWKRLSQPASYLVVPSAMGSSGGERKDEDIENVLFSGSGLWVDAKGREIPKGAIVVGHENEEFKKEPIYIARAHYDRDIIPGKLVPHGGCSVGHGGYEHYINEYEVLVEGYWVWTNGNNIPVNAVPGGITEHGEPIYIGRIIVPLTGDLLPGGVLKSIGKCYAYLDHHEYESSKYEIYCA